MATAQPLPSRARFTFAPGTTGTLTDYDVVMAYEILLGRHPENAEAIRYHKGTSFERMISGFLASSEFDEKVIRPLKDDRPVMRGDFRRPPSPDQFSWIFQCIVFSDPQKELLRSATSWGAFFTAFLRLGGIEVDPDAERTSATPASTATSSADRPHVSDTVLSRLNQIREMLAEIEADVRRLGK
jgi:hypothetical protein